MPLVQLLRQTDPHEKNTFGYIIDFDEEKATTHMFVEANTA